MHKNTELLKELNVLQNLYDSNKLLEAQKKADELIKIFPKFAKLYNFLGLIYKKTNDDKKAAESYEEAIKIDPNFIDPYNNLGNLYSKTNKIKKSISNFKKAIKLNPKLFILHHNLGVAYKSKGDFKKAKGSFLKALKIKPDFFYSYRNFGLLEKWKKKDNRIKKLKATYLKIFKEDDLKRELAFTLGKAHDDILDYKSAFGYFKEANRIHRLNSNYSIKNEEKLFQQIKISFNKNLLNDEDRKINKNFEKITPIFIVGMPRSGTSLIEQILSNHSKIFASGELNFMNNLINENLLYNNDILHDKVKLQVIANSYIEKIKNISDGSFFITDKNPLNFKWIGLIKLILPQSKIIHCYRNPKDICISIFKNFFPSNDMGFSSSMEDIITYYHLYKNLFKYWHSLIPNFIFDLSYEDLIRDKETLIKKTLYFLNLKWEKKCLDFHKNNRPVHTASDVQIRKPIYKSSLNSWEKYQKYLPTEFKNLNSK